MYWTKNGSIPTQNPDNTKGWKEAPPTPADVPDGHEAYWDGIEWVIIPPKPDAIEGYEWAYYKQDGWVSLRLVHPLISEPVQTLTTGQITNLSTSQIGVFE